MQQQCLRKRFVEQNVVGLLKRHHNVLDDAANLTTTYRVIPTKEHIVATNEQKKTKIIFLKLKRIVEDGSFHTYQLNLFLLTFYRNCLMLRLLVLMRAN